MKYLFLVLAMFSASVFAKETVIKDDAVVCVSEADYIELLGFINDKDMEAFNNAVMSGDKCSPIPKGTKVFLLEGQDYKYNKIVQFRLKGDKTKFWTHQDSFAN